MDQVEAEGGGGGRERKVREGKNWKSCFIQWNPAITNLAITKTPL